MRIVAGAFADGVPRRDLLLSPDHAVRRDDLLVPVRLLVNGASIVGESTCRSVSYFHVELDRHDILLAENLPAESYLDTGNRGMFENGDAPLLLHPDLSNDQQWREAGSCVPFAADPRRIEQIWQRLAARAVALGLSLPQLPETTADPAIHVLVSGRRVRPISVTCGTYRFGLAADVAEVRLLSRSAIPSQQTPWIDDRRRLGVMVGGLAVRSGPHVLPIPLDHPPLQRGWWQAEWHAPLTLRRWTDGDAVLPLPTQITGPCLLELRLAGTLRYPLAVVGPDVMASPAGRRRAS